MNRYSFIILLLYPLVFVPTASAQFLDFVTTKGDQLMEGEKELRFVSYNIPTLHYIEDNQEFTSLSPWRAANEFEIRDALIAIRQAGGKVTRMYVISVRKENDDPEIIRHVEAPGKFNEEAFKAYDKVLQIANEVGVRVIIPLVDNWWWWGGAGEYAAFRGKSKNEFWTDSLLISDFKKTVEHIVNRVNTYTGIPFKEDKAILAWETGNELESSTYDWTRAIAAYIKSLDRNHLVIEGTHSASVSDEALADPNIDVVSTHHYLPAYQMISRILDARAKAKGRKPYFIGEFGYMRVDSVRCVLDSVIANGISGIMIWSMRQHNRAGGFYYHGPSYRWPGFTSTPRWDETNIITLLKQKAYEINGLAPSPLPVPAAPISLPIESPYKISWQGSTGATSYIIERRPKWRLFWWQWDVVDSNASDANARYCPLYSDITLDLNRSYYYRFIAKNSSGLSEPSENSNPVVAHNRMMVDEFENDAQLFAKSAGVKFLSGGRADRAKEDVSRLQGALGENIVYRLLGRVDSLCLDAFFTTAGRDTNIQFTSGVAAEDSSPVVATREIFEPYNNFYGYYAAVRYVIHGIPAEHRFVQIHLVDNIQLGRIEISHSSMK
jgi:hypothetical protein